MKKILFTAFSLVSMLFMASCSNDEITIDKTLPKHSVSYNVSTQDMYDTFGVVDEFRNDYLRDKNLCIGIFTYLYDSNGELIDNKTSTSSNFNIVQQSFDNLIEGQYTFVTIETLVDPNNGNKSDCWSLDDMQKLSTAKISQNSLAGKGNILGVSTEEVKISENISVSATPKALGSIVNFFCYNFDKSNCVKLGFGTKDLLNYYSLDPQVMGKDKYNMDLSATDKFNLRCSLTAANSATKYSIAYILEPEISWMTAFQDESNAGTSTWRVKTPEYAALETGSEYCSGFYYYTYKGNEYIPAYFGDFVGLYSWKTDLDDYVKSLTMLFKEPCLQWGASVETVKSCMTDYQYGNFKQTSDGDYNLWYHGKYRESEIDYYFDTSTDGLFTSVVFFDSNSVGEDEITSAFNELGYEFVKSFNEDQIYSKGNDTYIQFGLNGTNDWYVIYVNRYHTAAAPFRFNNEKVRTRNIGKRATTYVKKLDKNFVRDQLMICEEAISKSLK